MLKQYLAYELMTSGETMLKGYDFTFKQYCEALQKHIPDGLDTVFIKRFVQNFFKRYSTVKTVADDFDIFFAFLETEFETVLPLYERQFLLINDLTFADLIETSEYESTTDSNSNAENNSSSKNDSTTKNESSAESKSFGSRFPEQIVNHDSINFSDSGTHSDSSGNGKTTVDSSGTGKTTGKTNSHSVTKNKNAVGSRIDRSERFLALQVNVINEALNAFKDLFIMIY